MEEDMRTWVTGFSGYANSCSAEPNKHQQFKFIHVLDVSKYLALSTCPLLSSSAQEGEVKAKEYLSAVRWPVLSYELCEHTKVWVHIH